MHLSRPINPLRVAKMHRRSCDLTVEIPFIGQNIEPVIFIPDNRLDRSILVDDSRASIGVIHILLLRLVNRHHRAVLQRQDRTQ